MLIRALSYASAYFLFAAAAMIGFMYVDLVGGTACMYGVATDLASIYFVYYVCTW